MNSVILPCFCYCKVYHYRNKFRFKVLAESAIDYKISIDVDASTVTCNNILQSINPQLGVDILSKIAYNIPPGLF